MAGRFEEGVLEIAGADQEGVLAEEIERLKGAGRTAADLGCGPGSLLPLLAEAFVQVEAVDHSRELLDLAIRNHGRPNVRFQRGDLIKGGLDGVQVDVAFCVNVLLFPEWRKLVKIVRSVRETIKVGGQAVFVVPSFESVLHVYESLARCRRVEGAPSGLSRKQAEMALGKFVVSWVDGVVDISGVETKHWTRPELEGLLEDEGFQVERVRPVPYPWTEEIDEAPAWLEKRPPWDWLMVARRV